MTNSRNPDVTLTTNHSRLFGMLGTGWMRPQQPSWLHRPFVLGVGGNAVADQKELPVGDEIGVDLTFDVAKLPHVNVAVPDPTGSWSLAPLSGIDNSEGAALWLGPMPALALRAVAVDTPDDFKRLVRMSKTTSKVDLKGVEVTVGLRRTEPQMVTPPDNIGPEFVLKHDLDALAGAVAMGSWATDHCRTVKGADAPWLRIGLGDVVHDEPETFDEFIWTAAKESFRAIGSGPTHNLREGMGGVRLHAARMAGCEFPRMWTGSGKFAEQGELWFNETRDMIMGRKRLGDRNSIPTAAGAAAQAAMSIETLDDVASWLRDSQSGPEVVVLTTAMLAGLRFGYAKMPGLIRGDKRRREAVMVRATELASMPVEWPSGVERGLPLFFQHRHPSRRRHVGSRTHE